MKILVNSNYVVINHNLNLRVFKFQRKSNVLFELKLKTLLTKTDPPLDCGKSVLLIHSPNFNQWFSQFQFSCPKPK